MNDHFFKGFADELMKLGFNDAWGLGGRYADTTGSPLINSSYGPLLHEQSVPYDVEWNNDRQSYFQGLLLSADEDGKIVPGKLSSNSDKRG